VIPRIEPEGTLFRIMVYAPRLLRFDDLEHRAERVEQQQQFAQFRAIAFGCDSAVPPPPPERWSAAA